MFYLLLRELDRDFDLDRVTEFPLLEGVTTLGRKVAAPGEQHIQVHASEYISQIHCWILCSGDSCTVFDGRPNLPERRMKAKPSTFGTYCDGLPFEDAEAGVSMSGQAKTINILPRVGTPNQEYSFTIERREELPVEHTLSLLSDDACPSAAVTTAMLGELRQSMEAAWAMQLAEVRSESDENRARLIELISETKEGVQARLAQAELQEQAEAEVVQEQLAALAEAQASDSLTQRRLWLGAFLSMAVFLACLYASPKEGERAPVGSTFANIIEFGEIAGGVAFVGLTIVGYLRGDPKALEAATTISSALDFLGKRGSRQGQAPIQLPRRTSGFASPSRPAAPPAPRTSIVEPARSAEPTPGAGVLKPSDRRSIPTVSARGRGAPDEPSAPQIPQNLPWSR